MYVIRPIEDDDRGGLDRAALDGPHGPDQNAPRRTRTLVAVTDAGVVGAATVAWSRRHPDLVTAAIDVEHGSRRQGIASALLRAVEAAGWCDRSVLCSVERDVASSALLETAGFEVVMTSVTGQVDVRAAVATPAGESSATGAEPDTPPIVSSRRLTAGITAMYEEVYRARHTWAGRYTPPPDAPWIDFAGPPVDVDGAIQVAGSVEQPDAVASLHTGPFAAGGDAFLAPTSVLAGGFDQRVRLLTGLLTACLSAAAEAGIATITVEVDSNYDDLAAVVGRWHLADAVERDAWVRPAGRLTRG